MNSLVREHLKARLQQQEQSWNFVYRETILVPNGGSAAAVLNISQDAHFDIEEITGTLYGPVTADGISAVVAGVKTAPASDFPYPGDNTQARSGVSIKIEDQGSQRTLTQDFVFAEDLLTPGYGPVRYQMQSFKYLLRKASTLRIEARNRDTQAGDADEQLFHLVQICFKGTKYA